MAFISTRVWSLLTAKGALDDAWLAHWYREARASGVGPATAKYHARALVNARAGLRFRMGVRPSDPLPAYTSIGCYPMLYVDRHGTCMCAKCATEALDDADNPENRPTEGDVNYEDPELWCDVCNERIESAYADPPSEPEPSSDTTSVRGGA